MTLSVQLELALKSTNSYTTPLNIHRFVSKRNLLIADFSLIRRHGCAVTVAAVIANSLGSTAQALLPSQN